MIVANSTLAAPMPRQHEVVVPRCYSPAEAPRKPPIHLLIEACSCLLSLTCSYVLSALTGRQHGFSCISEGIGYPQPLFRGKVPRLLLAVKPQRRPEVT